MSKSTDLAHKLHVQGKILAEAKRLLAAVVKPGYSPDYASINDFLRRNP